jgi:hypothetical protein
MQQPQGQLVSGRYVPTSFFQNLVPLANIAASKYIGEKADTEQAKLAAAIRQNKNLAEQKISDLAFGTPNIPTEMAGPYGGNVPMPVAVQPGRRPDLTGALREINTNVYGAGSELKPLIFKQMMPELTPEERKYKAAIADGSFKGGFNAFMQQMSEKDKASLAIDRARLNLSAQEQAFNLGLPMGGGGGAVVPQGMPQNAPQVPLRTINPGSPVLAPGQQQNMPQTMPQGAPQAQIPRFNSKAEQDAWLAGEKKRTELRIEAQDKLPSALNTVNSGLKAITGMIGDTTVDEKGNLVYGKTKPHPGFNDAVGFPSLASGFGATAYIKGSDWKNFEARFKEIEGKSFLAAIDSLRGTGAISEVEGAKATSAINRMSLSQSPAEFVQAANELKDVMSKGYEAAQQRAGVKPFNPTAQPNAGGAKPKRLVYNLETGVFE